MLKKRKSVCKYFCKIRSTKIQNAFSYLPELYYEGVIKAYDDKEEILGQKLHCLMICMKISKYFLESNHRNVFSDKSTILL